MSEFISDIYSKELTISEIMDSPSVSSCLDLPFTRGESNNKSMKVCNNVIPLISVSRLGLFLVPLYLNSIDPLLLNVPWDSTDNMCVTEMQS